MTPPLLPGGVPRASVLPQSAMIWNFTYMDVPKTGLVQRKRLRRPVEAVEGQFCPSISRLASGNLAAVRRAVPWRAWTVGKRSPTWLVGRSPEQHVLIMEVAGIRAQPGQLMRQSGG